MNRRAFDALSGDQREILRRAAADTLRDALRTTMPEAETAAEYCRNGGTVVATSPAELAALEREAQRAYAPLEADPATKRLIETIRALKRDGAQRQRSRSAGPPRGLRSPRHVRARGARERIPDGIYRKEVTEAEMLATGIGETEAFRNYGIHTVTFKDGEWRDHTRSRANLEDCEGVTKYDGAVMDLFGGCADAPWESQGKLTWQLTGDDLYFTMIEPDNAFTRLLFGGRPWKKIG